MYARRSEALRVGGSEERQGMGSQYRVNVGAIETGADINYFCWLGKYAVRCADLGVFTLMMTALSDKVEGQS